MSFARLLLLACALSGCGDGSGFDGDEPFGAPFVDPLADPFGHGPVAVSIGWDPPLENEDGSDIDDLAGFVVHFGSASGDYTWSLDVGNVTRFDAAVAPGLYFFAVSAYDTSGNESELSAEIVIEAGHGLP